MAAIKPRNHVIWDLGNTLLSANFFGYAYEIGLADLLLYPLLDWRSPTKIYELVFAFLEKVEIESHAAHRIATDRGTFLPAIMCHWLSGARDSHELIDRIENLLTLWSQKGLFISKRQERLVRRAIQIMFDPEKLAHCMRPIDEGVTLLKECAESVDSDGVQRNNLFILSNWDSQSFKALTKAPSIQSLLSYFDQNNIVISGHIGALKPQPAIYEHFLAKYSLDPQECILIDDQGENIAAAARYGMTGVQIENGNYRKLRAELKKLGVI